MTKLRILIADDEKAARFGLLKSLKAEGREISEAADGEEALAAIRQTQPHLVFLDLNMPVRDGVGVLSELQAGSQVNLQSDAQSEPQGSCLGPRTEIVVVTANDNVATAVECIRLGAANYITKPYEIEQVRAIARRVEQRVAIEQRSDELAAQLNQESACGNLIGISRPMRELFDRLGRAAKSELSILVRGETGTGKELIAREVHRLSDRADGPFVAVNTAAIAESLAESELFGHVKGAFTGADSDRVGYFEQANGGTLFLDEIGDMPVSAQSRILRALQDRTIQRVGSAKTSPVDIRIVAATHQDLDQAIIDGEFRQDLLYRIRGVELTVPPLRARREDIVLLARHFLSEANMTSSFSESAVGALLDHHWPGNVRELQQAVSAAAVMALDERIQPGDLGLRPSLSGGDTVAFENLIGLPLTDAKNQLVEQFERFAIEDAITKSSGNVSAAARQLGIHRQNLQQKMNSLGIQRPG